MGTHVTDVFSYVLRSLRGGQRVFAYFSGQIGLFRGMIGTFAALRVSGREIRSLAAGQLTSVLCFTV